MHTGFALFVCPTHWSGLGEMTVTQASRAPGRVPSERATAWRSEYSVASVTSLCGTATITMGTSSICCDGSGLGW